MGAQEDTASKNLKNLDQIRSPALGPDPGIEWGGPDFGGFRRGPLIIFVFAALENIVSVTVVLQTS